MKTIGRALIIVHDAGWNEIPISGGYELRDPTCACSMCSTSILQSFFCHSGSLDGSPTAGCLRSTCVLCTHRFVPDTTITTGRDPGSVLAGTFPLSAREEERRRETKRKSRKLDVEKCPASVTGVFFAKSR